MLKHLNNISSVFTVLQQFFHMTKDNGLESKHMLLLLQIKSKATEFLCSLVS